MRDELSASVKDHGPESFVEVLIALMIFVVFVLITLEVLTVV